MWSKGREWLHNNNRIWISMFSILLGVIFIEANSNIDILAVQHLESLSISTCMAIIVSYYTYEYLRKNKINIWVVCFSFLIAFLLTTGTVMRIGDGEGCAKYIGDILIVAMTMTLAIGYVVQGIIERTHGICSENEVISFSSGRFFSICLLIILIAWLPVFLAYYPGIFAYDVANQIKQWQTGNFTTHHPIIHTLLLGLCYSIGKINGNVNVGIVIHSLLQMIILAMSMSYALLYLYHKRVNKFIRVGVLIFFALFPVNSILAISVTKDVIFSAVVLLFIVLVMQRIEKSYIYNKIVHDLIVSITALFMCLFRNNVKYAVFIWISIVVGYLLLHKINVNSIIEICILLIILMISLSISSMGMERSLKPRSGRINEMCSVPCVQMARCALVEGEHLPIELQVAYNKLGILADEYSRILADPVKGEALIEGQEILFVKTWINTLKEYPGICMDAFLYLQSGNLFLDDVSNAEIYGEGLEGRQGYLLTDTKQGYEVVHKSKFVWLENIYERMFSANEYQSIPVVSQLYVPAIYMWGLLFCVLISLLNNNKKLLAVELFLLLYFCTILLGPCALIRYMYPLVICVPVVLSVAVSER